MKFIYWDPINEIEDAFEDIDSLVDENLEFGIDLAADVYEQNNNVIAKISIPDIDPEKLNIEVEEDNIKIAGFREEKHEEEKKDFHFKEIKRGRFRRIIQLPAKVDADKAITDYHNGILTIKIPKK